MTGPLVAALQALPPAGHSLGACGLLRGFTRTAEGRRLAVRFVERVADLVRPFGGDAKSDDCLARVREAEAAGDWQGAFEVTNALCYLLNREIPYGEWTNLREYWRRNEERNAEIRELVARLLASAAHEVAS
ncbi:hypothetical protein [Deinococcus hopiensis]|uniref:Uncharacterized protein n=1 Tax=Deinococcus hopiensis KR-140 TaxID=695939 RepID=A0A1W1V0M9_9DEIO|nr:hypothetical protein [Deinococcus hopiensis]SMB86564.1 hypothetical protein SAMN00790413_03847 [Deinococcus hopiensis KR-140]